MYPQLRNIHAYKQSAFDTSRAKWQCQFCTGWNDFFHTSIYEPLGTLRCFTCKEAVKHPEDFPVQIIGLSGLERRTGLHYKLSLPPAVQKGWYAPHTVFVWACCYCGRSHRVFTIATRTIREKAAPVKRASFLSRVKSFGKSRASQLQLLAITAI
jgi:hypothetical protein